MQNYSAIKTLGLYIKTAQLVSHYSPYIHVNSMKNHPSVVYSSKKKKKKKKRKKKPQKKKKKKKKATTTAIKNIQQKR